MITRKQLQKTRKRLAQSDAKRQAYRSQELSQVIVDVSPRSALPCKAKSATRINARPVKQKPELFIFEEKVTDKHGNVWLTIRGKDATLDYGLQANLPKCGFIFHKRWVRLEEKV